MKGKLFHCWVFNWNGANIVPQSNLLSSYHPILILTWQAICCSNHQIIALLAFIVELINNINCTWESFHCRRRRKNEKEDKNGNNYFWIIQLVICIRVQSRQINSNEKTIKWNLLKTNWNNFFSGGDVYLHDDTKHNSFRNNVVAKVAKPLTDDIIIPNRISSWYWQILSSQKFKLSERAKNFSRIRNVYMQNQCN